MLNLHIKETIQDSRGISDILNQDSCHVFMFLNIQNILFNRFTSVQRQVYFHAF